MLAVQKLTASQTVYKNEKEQMKILHNKNTRKSMEYLKVVYCIVLHNSMQITCFFEGVL